MTSNPAPRTTRPRSTARQVDTPTPAADTPTAESPAPPAEKPAKAPAPECNVPGCTKAPELRGLCPAHRQTHRGFMGPKEKGAPQ